MSPKNYKPSDYLKLMPTPYQQSDLAISQQGGDPFLGNYLKIFQKILSGLDIPPQDSPPGAERPIYRRKGFGQILAPSVIGELFYPRFSFLFDPTNQEFLPSVEKDWPKYARIFNDYFGIAEDYSGQAVSPEVIDVEVRQWVSELLTWLTTWVDFMVDQSWDLDKMRRVLAEILPLFRARGTRWGLQQLIDLLMSPNRESRRPLVTARVANGARSEPMLVGKTTVVGGKAAVGGANPWRFIVNLELPPLLNMDDELREAVFEEVDMTLAIVDYGKPESTYYQVNYRPTMTIGRIATLGRDSLLGAPPVGRRVARFWADPPSAPAGSAESYVEEGEPS